MLTYVAVSAIEIGVDSDFAFYFIAIANASSLFGRYAAGRVADITGKLLLLSNNEGVCSKSDNRPYEYHDTIHGMVRDPYLRMAICQVKIFPHCCNRDIRVRPFNQTWRLTT